MKDINEVLAKLSANRIGCPNFVIAELERLYGEVDSLQQQVAQLRFERDGFKDHRNELVIANTSYVTRLAERDRTIARLRKELEEARMKNAELEAKLSEARKIEFSQDILATVQEEDLTEVRAQLREAQQTIAQYKQAMSDCSYHAESLYQIIQRGDLSLLDLEQAEGEYESFCAKIKALGRE